MDMYMEEILEHYKHPRNKGIIKNADIRFKDQNTLCGDEVQVYIKLDKNKKIAEMKTEGKGCAISQAAASMLTNAVKGKTIEDVRNLQNNFVFDLLQIQLSPVRIKCALLALFAVKKGIYKYVGEQYHDEE